MMSIAIALIAVVFAATVLFGAGWVMSTHTRAPCLHDDHGARHEIVRLQALADRLTGALRDAEGRAEGWRTNFEDMAAQYRLITGGTARALWAPLNDLDPDQMAPALLAAGEPAPLVFDPAWISNTGTWAAVLPTATGPVGDDSLDPVKPPAEDPYARFHAALRRYAATRAAEQPRRAVRAPVKARGRRMAGAAA